MRRSKRVSNRSTAGKMHACGHDAHTSIGLGVARMLAKHRDQWRGTAKFVFQPAEEIVSGARAMIADGVLLNPAPTSALSMHVWSTAEVGTVAITDGPMMAGVRCLYVDHDRPRRAWRQPARRRRPDRGGRADHHRAAEHRGAQCRSARSGRGHGWHDPRRQRAAILSRTPSSSRARSARSKTK